MRAAVDTNLLVRAAVRDDHAQAQAADEVLRSAEVIAVALPALCEFAWVLHRFYSFSSDAILSALEALLAIPNLAVNRPAVEAGLAVLRAGGDFADGVIAHEGRWLGGDTFVSFDKRAVSLLKAQGYSAQVPA